MADAGSETTAIACKPMLASSHERNTRGYRRLHNQEAQYIGIALERQREAIDIWHRLISLLDDAIRGEHQSPERPGTREHDSWELRLRLAATELNTAKVTLDIALAGYYAQSLGLVRRMLESWRLMVFARVRADLAKQYLSPDNRGIFETPGEGTIIREIKKYASRSDKDLLQNSSTVDRLIVQCHKGAHPSELGFGPMETGVPEQKHIGATYIEHRLEEVLSFGMSSVGLIIDELQKDVPISGEWVNEFNTVTKLVSQWHRKGL